MFVLWIYFQKRHHYKLPLSKMRMWHSQLRVTGRVIRIKNYIYIYNPITIYPILRLLRTPQRLLYLLRNFQHTIYGQFGAYLHNDIYKPVV